MKLILALTPGHKVAARVSSCQLGSRQSRLNCPWSLIMWCKESILNIKMRALIWCVEFLITVSTWPDIVPCNYATLWWFVWVYCEIKKHNDPLKRIYNVCTLFKVLTKYKDKVKPIRKTFANRRIALTGLHILSPMSAYSHILMSNINPQRNNKMQVELDKIRSILAQQLTRSIAEIKSLRSKFPSFS